MIDLFLMLVALAAGGEAGEAPMVEASATATPELTRAAEPQVPSGKFTTATEVKPILTMTKGNWVAVREYDGHDLVYFTHLMSWRCGLFSIRYALNDGPLVDYDLPPCDEAAAAPNAIPSDWMPIMGLAPQSVQKIYVEIEYDDLTTDSASFDRAGVQIP